MTNEILIGIVGLIISVLTYFAGVIRTERRHRKQDSKDRIKAVFNRYMDFRKTNFTAGWDGLKRAGAASLESDVEIRKLVRMIISHGEKNPISTDRNIDDIDLKILFTYVVKNNIDFLRKPINEIIEEAKAQSSIGH